MVDKALINKVVNALMQQHGVRPQYYRHLQHALFLCRGDVAETENSINQFYKNCRHWFF